MLTKKAISVTRLTLALLAISLLQGCGKQEALSPEQERFKAAMQTFSEQRYGLAQKISEEFDLPIPPQIHRFFQAAIAGDEKRVAKSAKWFGGTTSSPKIPWLQNAVYATIHETSGVYDCVWDEWKKDADLLKLFYEPILSVMPPGSIHFGGTDPGRFLMTLMNEVEGANIFCVSQNTLADATYLAHLRFVYGEQIWLPSDEEWSKAFSQFIDDIRAGRIPSKDATFTEGGVQIKNAFGVMAMNGIVTRHIFDNNKDKHEFFYQESYVLKWMYPYLEPCGLIMKLTPSAKITEEVIAKDMAFWANHIELLEQQPGFASNPAARLSFAILRTKIAGLYEYHEMYGQAETAFQQALRLDPTSTESTFRFSDMLVKQGRTNDTVNVLRAFLTHAPSHPGNESVIRLAQHYIEHLSAQPPSE